MAAIFLFDTLAAFTYPYLAGALNLTENQFAFLGGTAINDTSSVAGAQATYVGLNGLGDWNGALNVKLVRTTMLIFVALVWTIIMAKNEAAQQDSLFTVVKKTFPMFILGFVIMAGLNTFGVFDFMIGSATASSWMGKLSKFRCLRSGRSGIQDQIQGCLFQRCETDRSGRNYLAVRSRILTDLHPSFCRLRRLALNH